MVWRRGRSEATGTGPARLSRRRRQSPYSVAAVAFAAGLLFATNASLFSSGEQRNPQNLVELARAETDRLEDQEEANSRLRTEVEALVTAQPASPGPLNDRVVHSIGRQEVEGPGMEVQLWDAPEPVEGRGTNLHPDDLVVHQQDLEAVMNALWAGGAEAMTIQDQRITSTSGVRCVGNTLFLHGRTYSPPFVVRAIGDIGQLEQALAESPGVRVYQQYVDAVGLGWSTARLDSIEMPAYTGTMSLQHAEVIDEQSSQERATLEPFSREPDDS